MTYDACPRCVGRGYLPEARRPSKRNPHGLGFYARACPRCGGRGYLERVEPAPAAPAQAPMKPV